MSVLVCGDALVDLVCYTGTLPQRGGCVWGPPVKMLPGGSAANVAVGLARLGVAVRFLGRVGADWYGDLVAEDFRREGVDGRFLLRDPAVGTGSVFCVVEPSGERTFFACARGAAHSRLSPDDIAREALAGANSVFVSGVCLTERPARDALLTVLERCTETEITAYLDPNLRPEGSFVPPEVLDALRQAIALSRVVLIGVEELRLITGEPDLRRAAEGLFQGKHEAMVVKAGGAGALCLARDGWLQLQAYRVPVVDTVGAGDAFDAGFIAARLGGRPLAEAIRWGNAVAAWKVQGQGARHLPRRADLERFLEVASPPTGQPRET